MTVRSAVVLLSGGLDSATALAIARAEGYVCHALSVAYGQRHSAELDASVKVAKRLGAASHRLIQVNLDLIGGSALTDRSIAVPEGETPGIPVTYVPARNTLFLSLAMGLAEVQGAEALYIGVNAVDYSGYPDCRPEFIAAFQAMARLGTRRTALTIHTPLAALTKAGIPAENYPFCTIEPNVGVVLFNPQGLAWMRHTASPPASGHLPLSRGNPPPLPCW